MEQKDLMTLIYELYEQKMYTAAYAVLHSSEQAEDAVHDSFLKLIKYLPDIDRAESAVTKALVMKILKTTAIDQYRKNRNKIRLIKKSAVEEYDNVDFMLNVEEKTHINDLLNGMSEDYLDVIRLRCYYGFSVKETAEILSITEANVCKRMQRAKEQILNRLEKGEIKNA
jgi:RNA polymerase sigma factor, sigma-70 family